MSTDAATEAAPPVIRVLHGDPTAEEIGVVVALLSAMGGGDDGPAVARAESRWSGPAARLGSTGPGRDGWRFSGMPR
jgi:hypothetical protein